jgi:hypothetical protein
MQRVFLRFEKKFSELEEAAGSPWRIRQLNAEAQRQRDGKTRRAKRERGLAASSARGEGQGLSPTGGAGRISESGACRIGVMDMK